MTWQNLERYSAPKNTSHVESISSKTQEWETEFQSSSISQVVWVFASFCWVDLPGQGWNINQHTNDQKTHPSEVSIFYHLTMFKWSCEKYSLAADDTVRTMTPVAKGLPNQSVKNQDVKVRRLEPCTTLGTWSSSSKLLEAPTCRILRICFELSSPFFMKNHGVSPHHHYNHSLHLCI